MCTVLMLLVSRTVWSSSQWLVLRASVNRIAFRLACCGFVSADSLLPFLPLLLEVCLIGHLRLSRDADGHHAAAASALLGGLKDLLVATGLLLHLPPTLSRLSQEDLRFGREGGKAVVVLIGPHRDRCVTEAGKQVALRPGALSDSIIIVMEEASGPNNCRRMLPLIVGSSLW